MPAPTVSAVPARAVPTLQTLLAAAQARGEVSVARTRLVVLALTGVSELLSLATQPGTGALGWIPLAVIVVGALLSALALRGGRPMSISVGLDAALVVGVSLPGVLSHPVGYAGAFGWPPFVFFLVAIAASALRLSRPLVRLSIACNTTGAALLLAIDAGNGVIAGLEPWLLWTAAFVAVSFVADAVAMRTRRLVYDGAGAVLAAERARHALGAYVSDEVAELALAVETLAPGGSRQAVAVLFADLRDFTRHGARLPPERLVAELNGWLEAMVAAARSEGGVVDKFVGDGMMVVFGVPTPVADAASRALRAAAAMDRALVAHNRDRAAAGLDPLRQGIGVHFGEVVVGNIGTADRLQFTVIGDAVNIASRLEGLSKELGARIVASAAVVEVAGSVEGLPALRARGLVPLRGHPTGVSVYTVDEPGS